MTAATVTRCSVCSGGLPEVSVRMRDPFCSRACSEEHHETGTKASRDRASRQRLAHQLEEGTDTASLELRRVTVDYRATLIAEGRYGEEFVRAFAAYLITHKEPVTTPTVTWFSYRASSPTMRVFEDEDMP